MRIGIDIDNVISNFDDILLKEYLKQDKKLRNNGIINDSSYITKGMFDWSQEENDAFYYPNIERIAKSLKPLHNARQIIDKLKQEGNEIYIISSRDNGEYSNPYQMTIDWLKKYEIFYDKLILTGKHQKGPACQENKIDIMIEDDPKNCEDIEKHGVTCWIMDTRYNKQETRFERVKNWKEIHAKVSAMYPKKVEEKVNVILDTDTYNECDDQFAVAYLLKSQDQFNIEAITIAPYRHDNSISIEEGQEKSYREVLKICDWLDSSIKDRVYKGSIDYFEEEYNETNEAVEKIIEIARKNDKTYLLAIGAITNIALAIHKAPDIVNKIEIIWLGGHSPFCGNNDEFNFRQDVQAVKEVFSSSTKLTIIPAIGVASNLRISIYELEHYLKGKSALCDYLCARFYNDGQHGLQTRRPIWDISAVAYLINKDWFEDRVIDCPEIKKDLSYVFTKNDRKVNFVTYLDSDKIYKDLFNKL